MKGKVKLRGVQIDDEKGFLSKLDFVYAELKKLHDERLEKENNRLINKIKRFFKNKD
jgi:hypothetical protein